MLVSHNQPTTFLRTNTSWKGYFPYFHRFTSKNSSTRLTKAL